MKWNKMQLGPLAGVEPGAEAFNCFVADGVLCAIRGANPKTGKLHVSISHTTRYPTWDELRDARYDLMPNRMMVVMILPPKEQYVNVHPRTFHLWEVEDSWLD